MPKIQLLNVISSLGMGMVIWATVTYSIWGAVFGVTLAYLGKSWYLDRMIWLFEDMKSTNEEYKSWNYWNRIHYYEKRTTTASITACSDNITYLVFIHHGSISKLWRQLCVLVLCDYSLICCLHHFPNSLVKKSRSLEFNKNYWNTLSYP